MYQVYCLNSISEKGMELLTENYCQTQQLADAQAVLVRSAAMQDMALPEALLTIARAGAGVNNIPLECCSQQGIVVFNTPGANARSVVELALCGMLLGCRDVVGGINWVQSIREEPDLARRVEQGKSRFAGQEIAGKRLGVIGLGAVGGPLANAAVQLGMEVYGYDPYISVEAAWHLDSAIHHVKTREELYDQCDVISLHVPLMDSTRRMIDAQSLEQMKKGVIILNFARGELVDDGAMEGALQNGTVRHYVTDFPNERTASMPGCIAIPHLGASTEESEDNCARMAVSQMKNYLENGNIINSVNFPDCDMGVCASAGRIAILHRNIPNSLGRFTTAVAAENVNIAGLVNKSRGEYAYTMLDVDHNPSQAVLEKLGCIDGVLRVRVIR